MSIIKPACSLETILCINKWKKKRTNYASPDNFALTLAINHVMISKENGSSNYVNPYMYE